MNVFWLFELGLQRDGIRVALGGGVDEDLFKIASKQCRMIDDTWGGAQNALFKFAAKQYLRLLMMLNFDAYLCVGGVRTLYWR